MLASALTCLAAATLISAQLYTLTDDVSGEGFYDFFNFDAIKDPTHGRVVYVTQDVAIANNLTYAHRDTFVLRTDYTTVLADDGPGRNSVRLKSKNQFGTHVVVADLRHMPQGCGTWPAIWEKGQSWPIDGEVDILEGKNDKPRNLVSVHTSPNCTMPTDLRETGKQLSTNCDTKFNFNQGCGVQSSHPDSYGPRLNAIGGGWFAMEHTPDTVKVWFWPRYDIFAPLDVQLGLEYIDTKLWGTPDASFASSDTCDLAAHFQPQFILINLTLCGDYAGNNFEADGCGTNCTAFVDDNPAAFAKAYFDFKALRVYQPPATGTSTTTSAELGVTVSVSL